ncbi:MAG: hypothetical protein ACSHYF_16360 [Verrucomicrobiaceae bacterium]
MDELLALLIGIFLWPYTAWKETRENSALSNTEFNRKTTNFWWWFGIIGICLTLGIIALILLAS